MSGLMNVATASTQGGPQRLRPDEYDSVALIYNQELSALGNRALYPICIDVPSWMPTKPLLQYLRRGGFEVSDPTVCQPAMARGGNIIPRTIHMDSASILTSLSATPEDRSGCM
jgi:hypothetical protein